MSFSIFHNLGRLSMLVVTRVSKRLSSSSSGAPYLFFFFHSCRPYQPCGGFWWSSTVGTIPNGEKKEKHLGLGSRMAC